ncbi:uncharacterized protein LOC134827495 [Culicoides brevitarsis]|uniref:uncharacterized protein LOC134827495 n=1 Tax=Culicoides brevitarsis TaxID=469753 RepID=UPI00307CBBA7
MLTERCYRIINKLTPKQPTDSNSLTEICDCFQHIPFTAILNSVYLCNGIVSTEILRRHKFTHLINIDKEYFLRNVPVHRSSNSSSNSDSNVIDVHDPAVEFEILDLNFGHPASMTVLPNLYRAVKFLEKALENSGRVFIGDDFGNQKAVTILIAFIMYKYRVKFVESFQIMRRVCMLNVVLDTFLIAQLMEYEPILETQRRTQLGSSCSSEIRSSRLKRKKIPAATSLSEQATILRSSSPSSPNSDSFSSNNNNNNSNDKPNNLNSSISASFIITSTSSAIVDGNGNNIFALEQQNMET